eukprot:TRINITY_DN1264_c0_g1_i4.p1 TRINITY_DN1264_c0_g1~~TRINITY_DN1264_c0_g1_i4.p1  ORF type:complete len:397 (+),score=141.03 TRINITY_DN1264_c0_g1_i4:180-1370(+)
MVVSGMEYSELQRRNQLGRLKQKLAAKQAAEQAAAAPASGNLDAAADAEAAAAIVPESTPDPSTEPVDEAARLAALKAIQRIEEEQRRVAEKAAKGDKAVTQDMLRAAGEASQKVCNVGKVSVHTQDGSADLSPQERARLSAAIGNGKAQNVRCWTNARGQALTIDEGVVDPLEGATAALVFSGCAGCTYTVATTCAKIFLRHCVDFEIVLAEGSRVLTQTLEAERCERTKIRVSTRVCTLQIEQCKSVIVDVTKREHFGNTTMMHKGRDFGNDGFLIWAGCDDLRLRIGADVLICDYSLEERLDRTVNRERSQFKVGYSSLGVLISEKVTRLRNGFPSTQREEDEFDRRENELMQGLAQRMGVAIRVSALALGLCLIVGLGLGSGVRACGARSSG